LFLAWKTDRHKTYVQLTTVCAIDFGKTSSTTLIHDISFIRFSLVFETKGLLPAVLAFYVNSIRAKDQAICVNA